MMTHSGERPFACAFPGCHKSFGRSDNFTAHVRTHEANRRKSSVSGLDVGSHKRPAAETSEELKRFKVTDDDSSANSPFSDASDNGSRSVSPAQLSPTAKCCSIQMMLNDAAVPEQTRTSLTEIDGPPERTSPTQQAAERSDEEKKNSAAILLASMRTSSSSAARASSAQDRRASYLGAQFTYPTIPQQGAQPVFVLPPPATQFQFQHPQSGMVIAGGAFPPGSFVVPLAHVPHQSQAPMEPAVVPLNNRPRSRTLPTMPNLLVLPAQLAPCPPYAVPAVPPGPFRTADALKAENDPAVAGRHLAGAGSGASGTEGDEADAPASKPHCCHHPGCARRFKRREHLRRHLRTHTSEKPFECPVCHKNFSRNDNLTQHIRIHRGSRSQQRNFEAENDDGDPAGSPAATAVAAAVPSSPISDDQLSDPSASAPSSPITDAGAAASSPPPKAASGMGGRGASA
ncbi:MAG: hypothetical protein BJ554DRAFT_1218 [Olpidium bornovanus]|uniref:C2H2-type domain-containing protein n=1 Tax=Olpidium bornovanus TaxID=278681 RepID=A0A8H7ZSF2_9FUNG|nr:MAG: hypothetical protein BJ554DRAFT_1218 [Olpidium bornovanus]